MADLDDPFGILVEVDERIERQLRAREERSAARAFKNAMVFGSPVITKCEVGVGKELDMGETDLWAHRSEGMRCRTCMWFIDKRVEHPDAVLGRCRRHAPTLGGWPAVFDGDWCGDHKLDERKLGKRA